MNELEILKQKDNDIKELKRIATQIWNLNQELQRLELNGLLGSEEYLEIEIQKEKLIREEDNLYAKIKNNPLEILDIFDYFKELVGTESLATDINIITHNDSEELINLRIFKLIGRYVTNSNIIISDLSNIKNKMNLILELNNLNDHIKEDIINTILAILNLYLNNPEYINIKKYLVTFKYNIEFVYPTISATLINSDYSIPKELYWKSIYEGELLKIKDEDLDKYYDANVKEIFIRNINYLTDQFYLNLEIPTDLAQVTIAQILIRSMALFINDQELKILRERFANFTVINKIIFDDKRGEELVYEALIKYQKDLELPRIIRLERTK